MPTSTMGINGIAGLACAFLAGCSSTFHAGLANAPRLDGDTPETHVHDAIANSGDACERSGFPPGEVLRGHVPPCPTEKVAATVPLIVPAPPLLATWPPPWEGLGVCASDGAGLARREVILTGISVARRTVVCQEPW